MGKMEIIPECRVGESELSVKIGLKKTASDENIRSTEEAEEKDLEYLIENSCMICGRPLQKQEIKIMPPQYMLERDKYVTSGIVARRYICAQCYTRMASSSREMVRSSYRKLKSRSKSIVKSLVLSMMQNKT